MSKSVALANSLHHGELRICTPSSLDWHDVSAALFSHGLGTVNTTDVTESNGKVEWLELFRVDEIESIRPEDTGVQFVVTIRPRRDRHRSRRHTGDSLDSVDRHDASTPTTTATTSSSTTTGTGIDVFRFEANAESDRMEWIRALMLAKQLRDTRPERRASNASDAFVRFASSDSEDYDSDSTVESLDAYRRFNHGSVTKSEKASNKIAIVLEVTVVDRSSKSDALNASVSISIQVSESMCHDKPLHQLKLQALDDLRKSVLDTASHPTGEHATAATSISESLQAYLRHEADYFVLFAHQLGGTGLWLKDEHHPLARYLPLDRPVASLSVRLEPVSTMPFPKIQLSISTTKNRVSDLSQKNYTAYLLDVAFNDMKWQVQRRFKEFHALHQELKQKYAGSSTLLPKLPSKHVFTPLEGQFITKRRAQLEKYVLTLLDHPQISMDVLLLSFLGVVSTSRDRDLSKSEKSVIHVTALHVGLDFGDIVLFSCRFGASVLQRKVTRAKYDHIGIVVPGASRNLLRILEATGEGIQVYSLKARLMAYSREVSNSIVVRRLHVKRTSDAMKKMVEFVARVEGNPYSILGILQARGESERLDLSSSTTASGLGEANKQQQPNTPKSLTRRSSQTVSTTTSTSSDDRRPSTPTRRRSTGTLVIDGSPQKTSSGNGSGRESPVQSSSPKQRKYFCSSLAAAALKHLGWLETTHTSSYFWPGSFEEGGEIEKYLSPGISISKETVVDCRIVEVGLATSTDS